MLATATVFLAVPLSPQTAGRTFRDCTQCPEMVVLSPGSFLMGSTAAETDRERIPERDAGWEQPQHAVDIRYALAMARVPVTVAQWEACLADGGCNGYDPDARFRDRDRDAPVVHVSWLDAQAYVAWLNSRLQASGSDAPYRLPTEAEWEYAARAGTTTARWWGDKDSYDAPYARWPQAVGRYPANPFGLQDMLGLVLQWTVDCWTASYAGAPADGSSPADGNCQQRVVRGGSGYWRGPRSAARSWRLISLRSADMGIRVVRSLP